MEDSKIRSRHPYPPSPVQAEPAINYEELEALFQVLEHGALRKLVKSRAQEISLVEHRRAHNICIELSAIRKPFKIIKVGGSTWQWSTSQCYGGWYMWLGC